jgi:hypothetical protein
MPQLAQAAQGLHPPQHVFDQLALALATRIAGVLGRPAVDGPPGLRRDMRRDFKLPHLGHGAVDRDVFIRQQIARAREGPTTVDCSFLGHALDAY